MVKPENLLILWLLMSVGDLPLGPLGGLRAEGASRTKRGLVNFAGLIKCMTGRVAFDYNNYGCYCGYGPAAWNFQPMDDIDRCCKNHDLCYRSLHKQDICSKFQMYFDTFNLSRSSTSALVASQRVSILQPHAPQGHQHHPCHQSWGGVVKDLGRWIVDKARTTMAHLLDPLTSVFGASASLRRRSSPASPPLFSAAHLDFCGHPDEHESECGHKLCQCDQLAAKCFQMFDYPREKPVCDRTREYGRLDDAQMEPVGAPYGQTSGAPPHGGQAGTFGRPGPYGDRGTPSGPRFGHRFPNGYNRGPVHGVASNALPDAAWFGRRRPTSAVGRRRLIDLSRRAFSRPRRQARSAAPRPRG